MTDKMLSAATVCNRFDPPISVRTIDRWINDPRFFFPAPTRIGARRFWPESEIEAWMVARAATTKTAA